MEETLRGSGRTTRAVIAAPPAAMYVVCDWNQAKDWAYRAPQMGRSDVTFVPLSHLDRMRGCPGERVYDHFVLEGR